jgi:hypothetical protein
MGARLLDVVGPKTPVKADRVVEGAEVRMLGLGEARHGPAYYERVGRQPVKGGLEVPPGDPDVPDRPVDSTAGRPTFPA